MQLEQLTLETIAALQEGGVGDQAMRLIDTIRQDIIRRPGVKTKRELLIKVSFEPKTLVERDEETGIATATLQGAGILIDMKERLPARKSIEIDMGVTEQGFFFNPDSPHDHRQRVLPGVFSREADVRDPG